MKPKSPHSLSIDGKKPKAEVDLPLSSDWTPGRTHRRETDPIELVPEKDATEGNASLQKRSDYSALKVTAIDVDDERPAVEAKAAASVKTAEKSADTPPTKECPKCGYPSRHRHACDRCGLIFAKWRPEMAVQEYRHVPAGVRQRAEQLWDEVADSENREQALAAFHDYCMTCGARDFAAVRYRTHLVTHPDDSLVIGYRDKLLKQAALLIPAPGRSSKNGDTSLSRRGVMLALGAAVLLSVLVAWAMLRFLEAYS